MTVCLPEDSYEFTCLGTPLPAPETTSPAERMALRDDFQYTAAERLNRYCITSPAGKPLNQQIGLWIDMLQSLLDTELVLLLEENNQKDRDCPSLQLSAEQVHHWLDEINDTMTQTASRVLQAHTRSSVVIKRPALRVFDFVLLLSVQRQFQRLFFQIQLLHQPGVSVLTDILTFTQLFEGIPLRLKRCQ